MSRPYEEHRPPPDPPHPGVARVDPHAVYDLDAATRLIARPLGLAAGTLRREARLGRLRAVRRGGRYLVTGRQLLRWAEGRRAGRTNAMPRAD
jgi:hypothetical protein